MPWGLLLAAVRLTWGILCLVQGVHDSSRCLRDVEWWHHFRAFGSNLDLWRGEELGGWFQKSIASWLMLDKSSWQG